MQQYDIAIVGGGMVGGALACALSSSNLSIAVIEKAEPKPFFKEQPMDLRVSAISAASADLLKEVNAWNAILAMRSCPYRYLETWEGPNSNLLFDSQQMGHPQLGHIIENRLIQLALWQQMQTHSNIELLSDATISQITRVENGYQLNIGDDIVHCKLLVGADGANSMVRSAANIGVTSWDYAQHAMLINITTEQPQQDITWQQFYPSGPRALLPLSENHASLVWYDSPSRIKALSQLPLSQLKNEIVEHFPNRLGEFDVDNAGGFPLTRRHAQQYVKDHLCILGDAAHTINPLAGQGVNLGFKDVAALSSVICNAVSRGESWWDKRVLQEYESKRRPDNLLMQSAMDVFYLTFSNDSPPLKLLRNTALKAAQRSAWGKKQVMKYAMGL
ncbi:FAD-dependent monooxygenase [Psychrobium sp. MM17-31]|uniref:FAD-dependent monooxygenase n=1 Tax=Psychrobium sp. MM17-31 TaxID=2917758 RepID=UPI001EF72E5A|nr:FAD-dependent monooxygenase [Psychrobium sp. MM17-31]MCG7531281.1 FAD-dependent monooxygenase [Psychrobium sp. MM17-31]